MADSYPKIHLTKEYTKNIWMLEQHIKGHVVSLKNHTDKS